MKNIALILGAGTSKTFGLPLTYEIFPGVWKRINRGRLLRVDQRKALINLIHAMYPGIDSKVSSYLPNITEVLSMIDHLIETKNTAVARTQLEQIIDCRRYLEIATIKFIEENFYDYAPNDPQDQRWDQFIEWIYGKRKTQRTDIISTNYDITVEFGLQYEYTYDKFAKAVDFGITWRDPYSGKLHSPPDNPTFGVYKLHGSTNWLKCQLCDQMYIHIEGNLYHNTLTTQITDDNTCHCGHGRLSSVIVSPSLIRNIADANLKYVWYRATEQLRRASEWIIIGYSMPAEDLNIKSILMRAFSGRTKKPKITVVQFDRDDKERLYNKSRFEAHFGKVTYYHKGLEDFLDQVQ